MHIIKIGGAQNIELDLILQDFAKLDGDKILIHGASHYRNELAEKLGTPIQTLTSASGISFTKNDQEALDIFAMAYPGFMNTKIVQKLQSFGCNAVGLSGVDGQLLQAKRKQAIKVKEGNKVKVLRDELSGKVHTINKDLLDLLIQNGYTPVICLPALSEDNQAINSDNDPIAALLAETFEAEDLIYLSDTKGLYQNFPDEDSLISEIKLNEIDQALEYAQGRMKRKILGAKEALEKGVKRVILADGRVQKPIQHALDGHGTVITI